MPYEISWYVDKRVIRARLYSAVLETEMLSIGEDVDTLTKNGTMPLYLIIDLREVTKFPFNVRTLLDNLTGHSHMAKQLALTIILSNSSLFSFFGVVGSKILNVQTHILKTMEEADQTLTRYLPDLEALKQASQEKAYSREKS